MAEAINLLVGGRSTEHDTSIHSYEYVLSELLERGIEKFAIAGVTYVDLENRAHVHRAPPWPRSAEELTSPPAEPLLQVVAELAGSGAPVFSVMHGNEGEDGAWQGLAEIAGLEGNFGPVFASALAMNKFFMSRLAMSVAALRVPRTVLLDRRTTEDDLARTIEELGGRPVVVKPNRMGSSLLTERYDPLDLATLHRTRERLSPYDSEILVQEYVTGQEYTAGCLELADDEIRVLPFIKVVTAGGFLGHKEKHERGLVQAEIVGADDEVTARVGEISRTLFRAFDFLGMCRFDYILSDDDELYFLEANSLPGLSRTSAFPRMLRAGGFGMADLVSACIDAARRRPKRRKALRYESNT